MGNRQRPEKFSRPPEDATTRSSAHASQVLEACCGCSAQPAFQAAALQAVRGALQKSQQNSGGGDGGAPSAVRGGLNRRHADWAWACAARTLPAAAAEVHGLMRGGNAAALGAPELLVR